MDTFACEADRLFWMLDALRPRTHDQLGTEFVFWADAGAERAALNYVFTGGTLLVTNVYEIRRLNEARIEKLVFRWAVEQAR